MRHKKIKLIELTLKTLKSLIYRNFPIFFMSVFSTLKSSCILTEMSSQQELHSSRMHTAHLLTVSPSMHCAGGSPCQGGLPCQGVCLAMGGSPCQGGLPCQGGSVLPGGSALPGGLPCHGGVCLARGVVYCQGVWYPSMHRGRPSPVNRITDACENITLLQLRCGP